MGYRNLLFDGCGDASAVIGDQFNPSGFVKELSGDLDQGALRLHDTYHRLESQRCHRGKKLEAEPKSALTVVNRRGFGYRLTKAVGP